jgi:uncharacterized protein YjbI with pentapeptide repeats
MNSFQKCRFDGLSVVKYIPYQTLFEDCSFINVSLAGLKVRSVENRTKKNPDLASEHRGTMVFRKCRFENTTFKQSYFDGIVFDSCEFEGVSTEACDFRGIICETRWWNDQKRDPFTVFLANALDLIREKCGKSSDAYREFANYVLDYTSGKITSKDFSACLYSEKVPYQEMELVIKDLRKLVAKFPF